MRFLILFLERGCAFWAHLSEPYSDYLFCIYSFLLLEHCCTFWAVPASFWFGLESHTAKVEPFNWAILVVTPAERMMVVEWDIRNQYVWKPVPNDTRIHQDTRMHQDAPRCTRIQWHEMNIRMRGISPTQSSPHRRLAGTGSRLAHWDQQAYPQLAPAQLIL